MNLRIILESLKFYKMKSERNDSRMVHRSLLSELLIYLLPFVDTDFSGYFAYLESMLSGHMPPDSFFTLDNRQLVFLGLSFLLKLIGAFFFIMYATLFVGQNSGMKPRDSFKKCISAVPRFLLLLVLLLLLSVVSACVAFLPLLALIVVLYFLPLNMTLENRPLRIALEKSFRDSRQVRFFIFLRLSCLPCFYSLCHGVWSYLLSPTWFCRTSWLRPSSLFCNCLLRLRLMGMLYLLLVKEEPGVLPSKPEK